MLTPAQVLALLERADKWYLGGGRASVYAPAFPRWLDTPGFWDEAYFADIRLDRLYCLLALDENARPLTLRRALRRWTPDRLLQIYTVEGHPTLRVQEERVVTHDDTLACRLTLTNAGAAPARLHLMLWSLQDSDATPARDIQHDMDALSFAHVAEGSGIEGTGNREQGTGNPIAGEAQATNNKQQTTNNIGEAPSLFIALGGSRLPESWTVNRTEGADTSPLWQTSLFPEKFQNQTLPREMQGDVRPDANQDANTGASQDAAEDVNGLTHLALHYVIEADAGGTDALTVGASLALDRETALAQLRDDVTWDLIGESRDNWERYFASVPSWECDDAYLERAYWYRWYGLRLMSVHVGAGHLPHPCVFEGAGEFRIQDAGASACHVRETGWMRDAALAKGSLLNFLDSQTRREGESDDGSLPMRLGLGRREKETVIADWGMAARQLYHLNDDLDFVRQAYPGLARYAEHCDRSRDREQSGLYDGGMQRETERAIADAAFSGEDAAGEGAAASRQGLYPKKVGAACALYDLQSTLAVFARALNNGDTDWWQDKAAVTRSAVRALMWDKQANFYKDVDAHLLVQSPRKSAEGFYPFASDIAGVWNLRALKFLQEASAFGTPFPVPTLSADDPDFDAQGGRDGRRLNAPRNGRAWPGVNSQVVDALANAARTLDPALRPLAADLLERTIRLMFHDQDPKRPNSYEHYNPLRGTPCLWRGGDDQQHSRIVDLIIRHVAGVQPAPGPSGAIVIDPLPLGLRRFRLEGVLVRGHLIDVLWSRETGYMVRVDGREAVLKPDIERVEIPL